MVDANEFYDEDTLRKVYKALLDNGIFGQKAIDVVSCIQNEGILFREVKKNKRGRPPKQRDLDTPPRAEVPDTDAWTPAFPEVSQ